MAAQGAKNTTKALLGAGRKTLVNSGRNTLKVGRGLVNVGAGGTKLTVSGLKNGFSRGVKTIQDLIGRIKSNLSFKKFRIRRQGRWFKLEGKLNPWVLLASGEIREVDSVKGTDNVVRNLGETGNFAAKGSDKVLEGALVSNLDDASAFVKAMQKNVELRNNVSVMLKELDPSVAGDVLKGLNNVPAKRIDQVLKLIDDVQDNKSIIKAWEKIKAGGIDDITDQSDYIQTLLKMAKYQEEIASGSTGTVKYYRVQTDFYLSKALSVKDKNLVFNKIDGTLYISTTSKEHALYYAASKAKKGNKVEVIEFEVPKVIDNKMKEALIPQHKAGDNLLNPDGNLPQVVDSTTPGDPFGLPTKWQQEILEHHIKGSAKRIK